MNEKRICPKCGFIEGFDTYLCTECGAKTVEFDCSAEDRKRRESNNEVSWSVDKRGGTNQKDSVKKPKNIILILFGCTVLISIIVSVSINISQTRKKDYGINNISNVKDKSIVESMDESYVDFYGDNYDTFEFGDSKILEENDEHVNSYSNIYDYADFFSENDKKSLSESITELGEARDWAVFLVITNDTDGKTSTEYLNLFYQSISANDSGICLLINLENQQLYLRAFGEAGVYLKEDEINQALNQNIKDKSYDDYFTYVKDVFLNIKTYYVDSLEDYVLYFSDSTYLTEDALEGLNKDELRIARNEIYARHGRLFDDEQLQDFFDSKSWYHGDIEPGDFNDELLNEYEIANRDLIVMYEKKMEFQE